MTHTCTRYTHTCLPCSQYPVLTCLAHCFLSAQAVLDWVCETAARLGTRSGPSRTFLSFYAILMTEVSAAAKIDEALLTQLLSHIVTGLASDAAPDYRAGTMMLVAELASKAELGQQFLKGEDIVILVGSDSPARLVQHAEHW